MASPHGTFIAGGSGTNCLASSSLTLAEPTAMGMVGPAVVNTIGNWGRRSTSFDMRRVSSSATRFGDFDLSWFFDDLALSFVNFGDEMLAGLERSDFGDDLLSELDFFGDLLSFGGVLCRLAEEGLRRRDFFLSASEKGELR